MLARRACRHVRWGTSSAPSVATPPIHFLCSSSYRWLRTGLSDVSARGMRAILGLRSDSMVATNTLAGTSAIPSCGRPSSKPKAPKPKNKTEAPKSIPRRTNRQQVRRRGAQKNFRGRGQGAVKRRNAWTKSCPVLLPLEGGSKTGRHQWLRKSDRTSRVRASVRGHGAQPSAYTGWQRGALPLAVVKDGIARGHAVKVAPCASCDRVTWRAVVCVHATARGSVDFRSGSGVLWAACDTAQAGSAHASTFLTITQIWQNGFGEL